jgi:hypothetical protein
MGDMSRGELPTSTPPHDHVLVASSPCPALPWPAPQTGTQERVREVTWLCYVCFINDVCCEHSRMLLRGADAIVQHLRQDQVIQRDQDPCALIGLSVAVLQHA